MVARKRPIVPAMMPLTIEPIVTTAIIASPMRLMRKSSG
jgi:hypothetical protein